MQCSNYQDQTNFLESTSNANLIQSKMKSPDSFFKTLVPVETEDMTSEQADEEMSLTAKMNLFYSKSENNFGVLSNEEESSCEIEEISVISSLTEDGDEATSPSNPSVENRKTEFRLKIEKDHDSANHSMQNCQTPTEEENIDANKILEQSYSSQISKKVSLEFSLPSSNMEFDIRSFVVESNAAESESGSRLASCEQPNYSSFDDNTSDKSLDFVSTISTSSSINLQDKIDLRIQSGQTTGHIDFSDMKLPFFPSALLSVDISMVERLSLQDNHIVILPGPSLKQFNSLTWLDLRFNRIKSIPTEIEHLQKLQVLLLQGNLLRKLPVELGCLLELKNLQFGDNPIHFPPKTILKGGLEVIKKFLGNRSSKSSSSRASSSYGNKTSVTARKSDCESSTSTSNSERDITTLISQEPVIGDSDQILECSIDNLITPNITSEVEEELADADETIELPSNSRTEDGVSSYFSQSEDYSDLGEDSEDDSDICQCLSPKSLTSYSRKSSNSSCNIQDLSQQPRRLCEQIKREVEENHIINRKKSLHLILNQPGSTDEDSPERCYRCQKKIDKNKENSSNNTEYSAIPVVEMALPQFKTKENHPNKKVPKKKKNLNYKSSKFMSKQKLTSSKKVELHIKEEKLKKKRSDQASRELNDLQRLRSKLGLQTWRDDAKKMQQELDETFTGNWIPVCVNAPFAIEDSLLSPRLQKTKVPVFTRLNERQRRLSGIESDIKDCLRKLDHQERNNSEENNRKDVSLQVGGENSRKKSKTKSMKNNSSETAAVLNQLHGLRMQIQRLKLNSFI